MNKAERDKEFERHKQAFLAMGMTEERATFNAFVSIGELDGDVIEIDTRGNEVKRTKGKGGR